MNNTTDTLDLDALEAELDALFADDADQNARVEALIDRTHQPVVSARQQLADLEAIADHCSELTALVTRQQEELSAALDDLGI
jgi:ABC-type transporter Mla subunit MlaD